MIPQRNFTEYFLPKRGFTVHHRRVVLSKPGASKGWTCAFCLVPFAVVIAAVLTFFPKPKAAGTGSTGASTSLPHPITPATRSRIQASYASLPLAFEQNLGQTDPQVKYLARGHGYTLFLRANDAVFSLHSQSDLSQSSKAAQQHKNQKDST